MSVCNLFSLIYININPLDDIYTFSKTLIYFRNLAQQGKAQIEKNRPLTNVELHQVRVNHPVPANIGCQYASEYCTNYW